MRRLLQMVAGIVMLSGTAGCCYTLNYMTGVCDCEPNCCDHVRGFVGCGGCAPVGVPQVLPVVPQPTTSPAPRQLPPPVDK